MFKLNLFGRKKAKRTIAHRSKNGKAMRAIKVSGMGLSSKIFVDAKPMKTVRSIR